MALLPMYFFLAKSNAGDKTFWNSGIFWSAAASISGAIAGLSYLFAIRKGDVGGLTILSSTYPILTLIFSVFIFGETITVSKIVGSILVIIGVIAVTY